jgi:hypothetical protein
VTTATDAEIIARHKAEIAEASAHMAKLEAGYDAAVAAGNPPPVRPGAGTVLPGGDIWVFGESGPGHVVRRAERDARHAAGELNGHQAELMMTWLCGQADMKHLWAMAEALLHAEGGAELLRMGLDELPCLEQSFQREHAAALARLGAPRLTDPGDPL